MKYKKVKIKKENWNDSSVRLVLPIYNRLDLMEKFLKSFKKYPPGVDVNLFIIDNGNDYSSNLISSFMEKELPKVQYEIYKPSQNLGFPKSINLAINNWKNDFVIMNNDIEFTKEDWLKNIIEYSDKMCIDICSCLNITTGISYYGGVVFDRNNIRWLRFDQDTIDPTWVFFTCCYVKNKVISKISGLDEGYSPGYFEDVDFCITAVENGLKIGFCPDVEIHHFSSSSFQTEKKKQVMARSKERFFQKWKKLE